jgi:2-C-methyl-D-erythritol 4-phosphate cytidylyltransferase
VQTPQAFTAAALRAAYRGSGPIDATDCASLVEVGGGRIRVVDGDVRLMKITTAADLQLVESWL